MIKFNTIILDYPKTGLDDLFIQVCSGLEQKNVIKDAQMVIDGLREREQIVPTLFENEVGIPHASNESIKETTLVLVTSKQGIVYNDGRIAKLVIFLLTPPESGENHLQLMSGLSKILLSKQSVDAIINCEYEAEINQIFTTNEETKEVKSNTVVLAITACTTGIAHTYIAANALEYAAEENNVEIYVERQGANGIEKQIPESAIAKARGIIVAADVEVEGLERFNGLPMIKTSVGEPIENSTKLIQEVANSKVKVDIPDQEKGQSKLVDSLLGAFSKLIPIVTFAVIGMFIGNLFESNELFAKLSDISITLLLLSIPVFCGELMKQLAGKSAYPIGLFIGLIYTPGLIGSQGYPHIFIAVLLVIVMSQVVIWLGKIIKLPSILMPVKVHLITPLITIGLISGLSYYVVMPLVTSFQSVLAIMSPQLILVLQIILITFIVIGICYDYGGRVNKITNLIAIGLAFEGLLTMTACNLAIVIPPVAMGLLKQLDKSQTMFNKSDYQSSQNLLVTGFLAMSEGVKPFVNDYRKVVWPINIIGTLIGVFVALKLGAVAYYPLPAIWAWFLIDGVGAYVIGVVVGSLTIAGLNYIAIKKISKEA